MARGECHFLKQKGIISFRKKEGYYILPKMKIMFFEFFTFVRQKNIFRIFIVHFLLSNL